MHRNRDDRRLGEVGGTYGGREDENIGGGVVFSEAMREKRGVAPQQRRAVGTWRPTPPPRHRTITRKHAISVSLPHRAQSVTSTRKHGDRGKRRRERSVSAGKNLLFSRRFLPVVDLWCWLGLRFPRGMVVVSACTRPRSNNETF